MSRSTSTLIYWIRSHLASCSAQFAKSRAAFTASTCVLLIVLSSHSGWAVEKNAASTADSDGQRAADLTMQALASAAEPTEVLWLETAENRFLSLYRPAVDAAQMAIILLPGQLHHMADGGLLETLYSELPVAGWSCLLVALPAQTSQQNDALNSEASYQQAIKRINKAVDHVMADGAGSAALIADSLSAQLAIQTTIARPEITSGLVLWHLQELRLPRETLQQLANSQITLLDIVPSGISNQHKINRRRQFQLAGFGQNYRQISSPSGRAAKGYSSRRIQEWVATSFKK